MRRAMAALAMPLLAASLSACGGGQEAPREEPAVQRVVVQDRFAIRRSTRGFDETLSALFEALDRRDLTVFAVIDHAAAAGAAGAELAPTTVVIFGDPEVGTPLMAAVPVVGAELPLRALVYERGGDVFVATTGMANLARTYPLGDQAEIVLRTERALSEIMNEVIGP